MGGLDLIDVSPAATKIIEAGTLFGFMLLVMVCLVTFIMYLMKELKETRKENTAALIDVTKVMTELKEIVRAALHQKG